MMVGEDERLHSSRDKFLALECDGECEMSVLSSLVSPFPFSTCGDRLCGKPSMISFRFNPPRYGRQILSLNCCQISTAYQTGSDTTHERS